MSDGVCELSRIKGAGWLCTKPINGWIKCGQNTLKFMFSKKATKTDEIFTVDLTLCSKCQIDG